MNQKIWILFKNDLVSSINMKHLFRSGKQDNGAKLTLIVLLIMGILLLIYNTLTAKTLVSLEQAALIPTYMLSVSSIMMIFLSLLRANGTIFGSSDFEQVSTYPVSEKEIFISKLLYLYFFHLLISSLFTIPVLLVWAAHPVASPILITLFCIAALVIPVIPICIGVILGSLIYRLAIYFQHTNLIAVFLSLVLLGVFSYFVFVQSNRTNEIQDIGPALYSQITNIYLPSALLQFDSHEYFLYILAFISISCLLLITLILIGSKYYRELNLRLIALKGRNNIKQQSIKQRSVLSALWKKELSTLFSSYNYLLNSILGIVLLLFLSVALLLLGLEKIIAMIPISPDMLKQLFPFLIAAMLLISNPAASALSMEGNKIWILKTLPIEQKHIIHAKLACTFSLHITGFFISMIAFLIRFSPNMEQLIWAVLVPSSYSIFIATFGLMLNFSYPHFSWKNDMFIVKQSPPVLISAFTGMAVMGAPLMLILFKVLPDVVIYLAGSIILIGLSIIFYRRTCLMKLI